MSVILENKETGETRVVGNSGKVPKGWKIKEYISDGNKSAHVKKEREAKLAVYATKLGLPVPQFLDAARWLLQKDCPYCQLGTQVLRRISELGEERAQELVARVLAAKETDDKEELNRIRQEINGSN
jgi:hypothetical protein